MDNTFPVEKALKKKIGLRGGGGGRDGLIWCPLQSSFHYRRFGLHSQNTANLHQVSNMFKTPATSQ